MYGVLTGHVQHAGSEERMDPARDGLDSVDIGSVFTLCVVALFLAGVLTVVVVNLVRYSRRHGRKERTAARRWGR
jgi:heme/copper-type cytochrome/quinol oxidase subunit 2